MIGAMNESLTDGKDLNEHYQNLLATIKTRRSDRDSMSSDSMPLAVHPMARVFDCMIEDGLVSKTGSELQVNQAMKRTLGHFASFLKEGGELKEFYGGGGGETIFWTEARKRIRRETHERCSTVTLFLFPHLISVKVNFLDHHNFFNVDL